MEQREDDVLLVRLRAGEQSAFLEMVRRYQGAMLATARAVAGAEQAEDVVQESWLAAVKALPGFEGRSSLKTWLITITLNAARNRLRKARRAADAGYHEFDLQHRFRDGGHWQAPPSPWHDDSPQALLEQEVLRDCLERTLDGLPDHQREVLVLRERQQLALTDICNILALSDSNVRVLLHRARLRVFAVLEHFEETGTC